ncbi:MAG: DegT/DnrJ/EryC1/StrS family aminotransferase [Treponema sp.]|jgi:dTDP-4-amino-4,6-dideoxygalactose transaminase|nr:DegT/DnrJ/EryC1/StrS family aminotransferase [Treponema sp.]
MKIEVYSPTIRRKEMDAVLTALVEDKIGPGEQAGVLVQIAREKLKFDYCISLRSPAAALYEALKTLTLNDGSGVVISALSPPYYARVLGELRLTPLYADTLQGSSFMGRESIEKALSSKPEGMDVRAIVLHHTLGYVPDAPSIAELGFPLIEDCSQSFGTMIGDNHAGSAGFLTLLGLEEQDMLTAGSGCLLYASTRRDAAVLRNIGELPSEYGLPDMNAAMGAVQFREAAKNLEKRREIAQIYTQSALRTRHKRFIQSDYAPDYNNYAFSLILETGMKDVKAFAKRKEIAVESAFEKTLMGCGLVPPELCPEAYSLSLRTVLFPLYPRLTASEAEKVSKLILSLP